MRRSWRLVGMVTVLVAFAVAGCSADEPVTGRAGGAASGGPPVILPGAPGGQGRTANPGEQVLPPSPAGPNAADVRFVERMIPHHLQALEMAGLVARRSTDPSMLALSDRIKAAQRPEVNTMAAWLRDLGRPVPESHGTHGERGEPGMASPGQLTELRAARGEDFDRLFLKLMIAHHEGAVTMAAEVLRGGSDGFVTRLARGIIDDQLIEIRRMRSLPAATG